MRSFVAPESGYQTRSVWVCGGEESDTNLAWGVWIESWVCEEPDDPGNCNPLGGEDGRILLAK